MNKIIIGLDQALANTGYAIWSCKEKKIIDYGVIKTSSKKELYVRLKEIKDKLREVMKGQEVVEIYMEEVFCPRKTGTAWPLLLCVKATLELFFYEKEIQCKILSSRGKSSWRTILGIGSTKNEMKELVKDITSNEHIADAIGILSAGLQLYTDLNLENSGHLLNYIEKKNEHSTTTKLFSKRSTKRKYSTS